MCSEMQTSVWISCVVFPKQDKGMDRFLPGEKRFHAVGDQIILLSILKKLFL